MLRVLLERLGGRVTKATVGLGEVVRLAGETILALITRRPRWNLTLHHLLNMGVRSQVIVGRSSGSAGRAFIAPCAAG